MYIPEPFAIQDKEMIRRFIESNGFGILISAQEGDVQTTHTPMYISEDMEYIYGHIAKVNSHWEAWSGDVKVLFQGPHTYISPNDYVSPFNVPTWNYTAVSIKGTIQILEDDDEKLSILNRLVMQYESGMETLWELPTDDKKVLRMLGGIFAFRIKINDIRAKFKLNQNKSIEDREKVIKQLHARGGEMDAGVADLMSIEVGAARER